MLPGFTHTPALAPDVSSRNGIVLHGKSVGYSSPVIAEIDGDESNGNEVAVAGADGSLSVFHRNGSLVWQTHTPNASCNGASSGNKLLSSPAVGKLLGDDVPYLVIGYGGIGGRICPGGVVAYRGSNGAVAWNFDTKAFAKKNHYRENFYGVVGTPALADTDGDGIMEVGFGSLDRHVYLLNGDGSLRWYYLAADTVFSSPAFLNVDNDPKLEMIMGTDISGNTRLKPITENGGLLYAFKTDRRKSKRIGFRQRDGFVWMKAFDQVLQSSPTIGDVLDSNPGPEIVIGSGCFFPQNSNDKRGKWAKVIRPSDGALLATLNSPTCFNSSVAIGDIDGDGRNEIVATVNGSKRLGGPGESRVVAWRADNPEPLWSTEIKTAGGSDTYGGTFMSPVIADLDGNGSLEVVAANVAYVNIYEGSDGHPLTCAARGCPNSPLVLQAWKGLHSTPAIGDVNGDGVLDLLIGGGHPKNGGRGMLYGWTSFSQTLDSEPGPHDAYSTPCAQYRGDAARSGACGS